VLLVVSKFSSELWFELNFTELNPRFSSKFRLSAELNQGSSSRFRLGVEGSNLELNLLLGGKF
jgi:hypothetical protein